MSCSIASTLDWSGVTVEWVCEVDDDPKRPTVLFMLHGGAEGGLCKLHLESGDLVEWPFRPDPHWDEFRELLQVAVNAALPECPVCDAATWTQEHQGYCSSDCLITAAERQHEAFCEDFYGGSGPVTTQEHAEWADRKERGLL